MKTFIELVTEYLKVPKKKVKDELTRMRKTRTRKG